MSLKSTFMQPLEPRRLLSGTAYVGKHGVLHVTLDNHHNTLTVGYSDLAGSQVAVDINGATTDFPQRGADAQVVKELIVHCGAGSDNVSIIAGNGTSIKDWRVLTVIRCGAGNNTVTTGNENDLIFGGGGGDTITAGNGNDSILGGAGLDDITAGSGNDYIFGGGALGQHGQSTITASGGNDTLFGLAGEDVINTGDGTTIQVYTGNNDTVNAGTGDDTVFVYANAEVQINGSATVKHIPGGRRAARKARYAAYFAAIAGAEAQAAQAVNY